MSKIKKIIHIGHMKTATTTLQSELFVNTDLFLSLGKFGQGGESFASDIVRDLMWEGIFLSERLYQKNFKSYKNEIDKFIHQAELENKTLILSSENISFFPEKKVSQHVVYQRLSELFGKDCRIIFFIREQMSWLRSFYSSFVIDGGGTISFSEFIENNLHFPLYHFNILDTLDYENTIVEISQYFDDVIVLPFEKYSNNLQDIVKYFSKDVNISADLTKKTNTRKSDFMVELVRAFNKKFPRRASEVIEKIDLRYNNNRVRKIANSTENNTNYEIILQNKILEERSRHMLVVNRIPEFIRLCQQINLTPLENTFYLDKKTRQTLNLLFFEYNTRLQQHLNIDLKDLNYIV